MPRHTAIVTLLAVALYFFLATRVAVARGKFGVPLPATTGNPDFERVFRIHRKRTKAPASRPRPVAGVTPGSTALKCSRGVSRANAIAVARVHCFDVA
jgi:hypothetical protein